MIVANPPMIFSASILDTVSSGMVSVHTSIVLLSVVDMTTQQLNNMSVVVTHKIRSKQFYLLGHFILNINFTSP